MFLRMGFLLPSSSGPAPALAGVVYLALAQCRPDLVHIALVGLASQPQGHLVCRVPAVW